VSNFSPQIFKAMMWGLPAISLLFTFWLPAALQLSFLISGICSFGQATLLRQTWFRDYFKMTPIPQNPSNTPKPVDPYKGNLKVAANPILSQAELNARFQGAQETKKSSSPTGVIGKIVGKVTATGPLGEIKDAYKGVVEKATEQNNRSNAKADVKRQKRYEEKRQEELKKQRWEIENQKRAERAARKSVRGP
jgi:YidC/Oxa1 family membrane protein insertase